MKILIGNNGFGNPGGSETYNYAVIEELVRLGHDVHAIAKNGPGIVSDHINKLGVPAHFKPISGTFDLILLSHSTSIALVQDVKGFKVQTCHGVFPSVEQPVPGMNAYVAISEEVQAHLETKGYKSIVIRNGINCDRYKPVKPIRNQLKTVLSLAHSDPANTIIKDACDKIGCDLLINNKFKEWKWEVDEIINSADLVISLGRGAYESMAAGRNVVIFDKRGYMKSPAIGDGIVTKENVSNFIKNNCSGSIHKKFLMQTRLH